MRENLLPLFIPIFEIAPQLLEHRYDIGLIALIALRDVWRVQSELALYPSELSAQLRQSDVLPLAER